MSPSLSVIILSADERTQRLLLQAMDGFEMISRQKVFNKFTEMREASASEDSLFYLADLRLLPSAAQVTDWLAARPQDKLLILHEQGDEEKVLPYLKAGAMGHLAIEKISQQQLREAVCALLNGEAFLSPTIAGKILDAIVKRHPNSASRKEVQD